MEMMTLAWSYRPLKRLIPPGHPFFEEGDIFCNILRKKVNFSEELEEIIESAEPEFQCSVHGCNDCFTSIARYEVHYKSCHWNRCRFCNKTFQTSFLLELHILENHDTLFQIIARKKHMYRCLVETCPDKFNGEEERKKHLVDFHQYPADFRFNRPSRLQKKIKRKQAQSDITSNADSIQKPSTELPMDTDSATPHHQNGKTTSGENNNSGTPKQRLPKAICFGRGSSRGFQRGSVPKGHGKGKNKKKQGMNRPLPSTEVVMEDVS